MAVKQLQSTSAILVAVVLTWNTAQHLVGIDCQAITSTALSTETSRAIEMPILTANTSVKLNTAGYLSYCTMKFVTRTIAMSHDGQVLSRIIVHAVARLNRDGPITVIVLSHWSSCVM